MLSSIVPCLSITINCDQANHLNSFITNSPILVAVSRTIRIENCQNFTLNISSPLPVPMISLQLVNITNLSLELDTMSLTNIKEVVLVNSSIVGEALFVLRESAKITFDNCIFQDNVLIHYSLRQAMLPSTILKIMKSLFIGQMDIFIFNLGNELNEYIYKKENIAKIDTNCTNIQLFNNRFLKQSTIFTENVNVVIKRNVFRVEDIKIIGTIVRPEAVIIIDNTFEENKQVKFASDEYLDDVKGVDKADVLFDILAKKSASKVVEGNKYIVNYVKLNKYVQNSLFLRKFLRYN